MKKEYTMRIIFLMSLFLIFSLNTSPQVKKISTKEIEQCLNIYGLDSTLQSFSCAYTPIYKIDSALYLKMVTDINDYSSKNLYFLFNGANNMQDSFLSNKVFDLYKEHCSILKNEAIDSKYKTIKTLDNHYLAVFVKQKNDSIESFLKSEYNFWKNGINEVNKLSSIRRFFKSLNGEDLLEDTHYNCLIIMLGLKYLNSPYYSDVVEKYHRENLGKWSQDTKLGGYTYVYDYNEFGSIVVDLRNEYESLSDIKFEEEPDLLNLTTHEFPSTMNCSNKLIYNNKIGIFNAGCNVGSLSAFSTIYKLELVGTNKLKITILDGWMS